MGLAGTINGSSFIKSTTSTQFSLQSNPNAVIYALISQVGAAYLCHIFGKFACKIKIQNFSYALPLSLATPVTVCVATLLSQMRAADLCSLHGLMPDYLTLQSLGQNLQHLATLSLDYALWLWPLWWLAQLWTCLHIWRPRNDKNAPTEKLYVCPWYCGLLVDQCSMMNRRILDWTDEYLAFKVRNRTRPNNQFKSNSNSDSVIDSDSNLKFMLMNYCNQALASIIVPSFCRQPFWILAADYPGFHFHFLSPCPSPSASSNSHRSVHISVFAQDFLTALRFASNVRQCN